MPRPTITSADIRQYASSSDRRDHFDDDLETRRFVHMLKTHVFTDRHDVRVKPYGYKGVDVGVFDTTTNELVCAYDLERSMLWGDDWPSHWRCLSFLARKDRYLKYPQFGMVWFNRDVTTCVVVWKQDILDQPTVTRHFKNRGYTDQVRQLPFSAGTLVGRSFGVRETALFADRRAFDFSQID